MASNSAVASIGSMNAGLAGSITFRCPLRFSPARSSRACSAQQALQVPPPACCAPRPQCRVPFASHLGRLRLEPRAAASDPYNHPALYSSEDAFSLSSYWDERYKREGGAPFEWYRDYGSLEPILSRHLDKAQRVLHVGVGTSRIQVHMHHDGYRDIVNVDYAISCIQQLSTLHADLPGLSYAVADCRTMPQYGDASFAGGVLDKGTLDALLCGESEAVDTAAMLAECYRVLAPGASYICITHASPRSRLRYLQRPRLDWEVCFYEVGQQGWREGPVPVAASSVAELEAYPKQGYSHFVYVCTRR